MSNTVEQHNIDSLAGFSKNSPKDCICRILPFFKNSILFYLSGLIFFQHSKITHAIIHNQFKLKGKRESDVAIPY